MISALQATGRCGLLVAVSGLTAWGCSARLELEYGQTLCDGQHPCAPGLVCVDSLCVPEAAQGDGAAAGDDDLLSGDWVGPPGDPAGWITGRFCRVDEQCEPGEACVDSQCIVAPCTGVTCPGTDTCSYRCLPTSLACDGVACADNLEECVAGVCLPSCVATDPCVDPGCDEGSDPNCVAGACINATLCSGGVCVSVTPCDDRFCPPGFVCSLSCAPIDPCSPSPCQAGWTCREELGEAVCIENPCSGLTCGGGEWCVGGECQDPCLNIDCALGGRRCPQANQVCCDRVCCAPGLVCRFGQCLPPAGVCDPPCADDEICINSQCYCNEVPPALCGSTECCIDAACTDVCDPNPCAANPTDRLCVVDCAEAQGFRCADGCDAVVCSLPNTVCDPDDGQCKCGAQEQLCTGGQCCVAGQCDDPCTSPNPCAGNPENRGCQRDCNLANGYSCYNLCAAVTCTLPNTTCDFNDGLCKCNGTICGANQCCLGGACDDPCSPDPCGGLQCVRDCNQAAGYTCTNLCLPTDPCVTNARNPDCQASSGSCRCHNLGPDTWATCNNSQCCEAGVCVAPCTPNPCVAAPNTRCNVLCAFSGPDYTCSDPCSGNNCATANGGRNPDCLAQASGSALCTCNAEGAPCVAGECCQAAGCATPCSPNPCTTPPNTRCTVACTSANDYTCANPCSPNPCAEPTPTCTPQADGTALCSCNGSACSGAAACCVNGNSTCDADVCAPNPCASEPTNKRCVRDCAQDLGYRCVSFCSGVNCSEPNPTCDLNDGVCKCNGAVCSGAAACCVGTNTSCDADVCSPDPCASNPTNKRCVKDCAQDVGYRCDDWCSGVNCASPLTCDPTDGVCGCGATFADCDPPGTPGATEICCNVSGSLQCRAPACATCTPPYVCDPCTGCVCPCEGCCP